MIPAVWTACALAWQPNHRCQPFPRCSSSLRKVWPRSMAAADGFAWTRITQDLERAVREARSLRPSDEPFDANAAIDEMQQASLQRLEALLGAVGEAKSSSGPNVEELARLTQALTSELSESKEALSGLTGRLAAVSAQARDAAERADRAERERKDVAVTLRETQRALLLTQADLEEGRQAAVTTVTLLDDALEAAQDEVARTKKQLQLGGSTPAVAAASAAATTVSPAPLLARTRVSLARTSPSATNAARAARAESHETRALARATLRAERLAASVAREEARSQRLAERAERLAPS